MEDNDFIFDEEGAIKLSKKGKLKTLKWKLKSLSEFTNKN
jgi:hypothetical protein